MVGIRATRTRGMPVKESGTKECPELEHKTDRVLIGALSKSLAPSRSVLIRVGAFLPSSCLFAFCTKHPFFLDCWVALHVGQVKWAELQRNFIGAVQNKRGQTERTLPVSLHYPLPTPEGLWLAHYQRPVRKDVLNKKASDAKAPSASASMETDVNHNTVA